MYWKSVLIVPRVSIVSVHRPATADPEDAAMKPRVGTTLASTTDGTTVVVVRWGVADLEVTCGGAPMVDAKGPEAGSSSEADPTQQGGTRMGKRYADADLGVELLCTRAGTGTLAAGGAPLPMKDAKPLPASD
jgi:hypothetical protein